MFDFRVRSYRVPPRNDAWARHWGSGAGYVQHSVIEMGESPGTSARFDRAIDAPMLNGYIEDKDGSKYPRWICFPETAILRLEIHAVNETLEWRPHAKDL
jgi:hypothetical protein